MTDKIKNGQFYTLGNPFAHPLVQEWFDLIPEVENKRFVEPFAGANNIVKSFLSVYPKVKVEQWKSYDIAPEAIRTNEVPEISLIQQDTLKNFPEADVVITNPPYLAKNSATRMKLDIVDQFGVYQDLYEVSIEKMLENSDYIAAIIPESFLTRKIFKDRLYGFVSIVDKLFDDTDFPVGIALWVPEKTVDYPIYIGSKKVGMFGEIKKKTEILNFDSSGYQKIVIKYNSPHGVIGLKAVDNTVEPSIKYVKGETIDSSTIKVSSRAITRIQIFSDNGEEIITEDNLEVCLTEFNKVLNAYREQSSDIFLTSFKGLRKDGRYRRRIDWKTSSQIIIVALANLELLDKPPQKPSPVSLFDL